MSYSDLSVWAFLMVLAVLLFSLLLGNVLRKYVHTRVKDARSL